MCECIHALRVFFTSWCILITIIVDLTEICGDISVIWECLSDRIHTIVIQRRITLPKRIIIGTYNQQENCGYTSVIWEWYTSLTESIHNSDIESHRHLNCLKRQSYKEYTTKGNLCLHIFNLRVPHLQIVYTIVNLWVLDLSQVPLNCI